MSKDHSLTWNSACEYGERGALLIHHFQFWVTFNTEAGKNFHEVEIDGKMQMRVFTTQTVDYVHEQFPYLSKDKIRHALEELRAKGVLITRNVNRSPMDKTLSYAFKNPEQFGVAFEQLKLKKGFDIGDHYPPRGRGTHRDGPGTTCYDKDTKEKDTKDKKTTPNPSKEGDGGGSMKWQIKAKKLPDDAKKEILDYYVAHEAIVKSKRSPVGWLIWAFKAGLTRVAMSSTDPHK